MATATNRITAALFLLAVFLPNAFAADAQRPPKTIPELQAAIEKVLKETKTPGAGVAIVSRDQAEWIAGLGIADVAANKPATADTLFRIGSTSKAFAALAALQLQEEGKLKLSDTVRQWVPDVAFSNPWEATDPVRLVHLMEHTSGFDDIHMREYALSDPTPMTLKDALAFGASSRVSRWRPGTRMSYCNSGPAVLAAVIEKVTGKRFEDYVQEHFFNPLHMDTASYFYTPEVQKNSATLYHSDGHTPFPYWHIALRPAGAINASARDMANYVRFYLQRGSFDGTNLLSPASIERMEVSETLPSAKLGKISGYGLYNYATPEGAFVFHGHNGAVVGGLTEMAYLPEYGRGYAVMINSRSTKALERIAKLLRAYVTRDLTPPALPRAVSVPAEIQRRYAGWYQQISPRQQLFYPLDQLFRFKKLRFTTNGLVTSFSGPFRQQWSPVSERLFRKQGQSVATLALLPDADGNTLIQSEWATFKKISAWRFWGQPAAIFFIGLIIASSPFFALIWLTRKLIGDLRDAGPLSVRVAPLVGTFLLAALGGMLLILFLKFDFRMGNPSFFSVSLMLLSIAFPAAVAVSLFVIFRERKAPVNRLAYWHSVLVTAALAAVAIYLGYWGWIGLRLWA